MCDRIWLTSDNQGSRGRYIWIFWNKMGWGGVLLRLSTWPSSKHLVIRSCCFSMSFQGDALLWYAYKCLGRLRIPDSGTGGFRFLTSGFWILTSRLRIPINKFQIPPRELLIFTSGFRIPTDRLRTTTSDFLQIPTGRFRIPTSGLRILTSIFRKSTCDIFCRIPGLLYTQRISQSRCARASKITCTVSWEN